MLFAVGAFASQGYFNIFIVFTTALLVNVFADVFGYFITYKYGNKIMTFFKINIENDKFLKVKRWLRKYAGETIFITRITGPFTQVVNFLSGLTGVPFKKFLLMDVLGNFIDILFFTFAGYFLGNYWQVFLNNIQNIITLIFVVVILYILFRICFKKFFKKF